MAAMSEVRGGLRLRRKRWRRLEVLHLKVLDAQHASFCSRRVSACRASNCTRDIDKEWGSALSSTKTGEDAYHPHSWLQECLSDCLYSFGKPFLARWPVSYIRRKALRQIAEFLKYEDDNSWYIYIGTVQKALSMLCCCSENPNSDALKLLG